MRWRAAAYALESLLVAWLPVGAVGTWLGAGAGLLAVPLAVAIGIPVYTLTRLKSAEFACQPWWRRFWLAA